MLMLVVSCLSWFILILLVLLSVAFFTLFERKVMGLVHTRLGPNKVSYLGLLQPLLDAFKLLSKSLSLTNYANKSIYFMSPYFSLGLSLILWVSIPSFWLFSTGSFSFLIFVLICSVMVFFVLMSGWSSNSKYSFIGCMRSIAQSISYEAVFSTLLILVLIFYTTYSISSSSFFWSLTILYIFPIWLFSTLAETHRAPFDFSESESELVSGFNTEYMGSLFAFIFLSEYSTILASSIVISYLFFSFAIWGVFSLVLITLSISTLIILIRVTYCRFRYDLLMMSAWKSYLPAAMFLSFLYFMLLSFSS